MKKVLIACEFSGVVRDAFRSRGFDATSCDLRESSNSVHHIRGDIADVLNDNWDLVIAHPPCTALCVTGNRHYVGTKDRSEAIEFFRQFLDCAPHVAIENPVGIISSVIRPPDQYIHPYQFGDPVKKKTGLWLKNLPKLQPTNVVEVEPDVVFPSGKRMSKWYYETSCLPHNQREAVRSTTFKGIAEAMAQQWGDFIANK